MLHAPHAAYVVAAYVASGVAVAALTLDTWLRARRWKAKAQERNERR